MLDDSIRYRLLSLLQSNPELSQRDLAKRTGISLGKTNYCLKALTECGWVKIQNFQNCRNKSAYLYVVTPAGVAEKIRVTRRFLARKVLEHAELTHEIQHLRREVRQQAKSTIKKDSERT
jgi:EPS-associated MarR family transcriptional regulator